MKKLQLIILAILISIPFYGQGSSHMGARDSYVYAEIIGKIKYINNKLTVSVDFGQNSKLFEAIHLRDNSGKEISFDSMIDAMNIMDAQGWELVQTYVAPEPSRSEYHWLLKLSLKSLTPAQLKEVKTMIRAKRNLGK